MSEHRTHPVTLLQMIWRFLFLLIFPAARGFLTALSGGNVAEWLDGAMVVPAVSLGIGRPFHPQRGSVPAENVHSRR